VAVISLQFVFISILLYENHNNNSNSSLLKYLKINTLSPAVEEPQSKASRSQSTTESPQHKADHLLSTSDKSKSVTEESSRRLVLAQQKSDQSQFAADQLKFGQLQLDSNTDDLPDENNDHLQVVNNQEFSTSVFCTGKDKKHRECRFQNLCYDSSLKRYIFFNGIHTTKHGLGAVDVASYPLVLDLSSVDDHNAKYFYYDEVETIIPSELKMRLVKGGSILFHRFNPENLMHVLHDDLLPYVHTKRKYYPLNNVTAVLMDGRDRGPYFELYETFMDAILMESNLTELHLTCFEDVVVGVSKATTWYQYGFKEPQGPINVENYPRDELQFFKREFLRRLGIEEKTRSRNEKGNIVFFTRQHTRKILNEMKLVFKLASHFKTTVTTLDLQLDSFKDVVEAVSNARFVIGVHGAHLVTSLFMPSNAALVEVFPFGIPAVNYTPYKTLVRLLGRRYISWENTDELNTVAYPDREPRVGGISHLPVDLQASVQETKKVGKHLCCSDPYWLYRIYQDTKVDIQRFVLLLEADISKEHYYKKRLRVETMHCDIYRDGETFVYWRPPPRIAQAYGDRLVYDVLFPTEEDDREENRKSWLFKVRGDTWIIFRVTQRPSVTREYFHVRSTLDGIEGEFSEKKVCTHTCNPYLF